MRCGVRFCGGCNPKYDRGGALEAIRAHFAGRMEFVIAEEGVSYDLLLVIGGCTACCASHSQFTTLRVPLKMWDKAHTATIIEKLEEVLPS